MLPADTSPFLVLWYLFLAFFSIVLIINCVCLGIAALLRWRTAKLRRKVKPHANAAAQTN